MHPADQHEAYARLRAKDMTAAEIRTAIVKACLECEPELAFDLAAYQTVSAIFGGKPDGPWAVAFGKYPPPASIKLADDARRRALRWTPPGFEPARASAAESAPADIAPAVDLPAWMNG